MLPARLPHRAACRTGRAENRLLAGLLKRGLLLTALSILLLYICSGERPWRWVSRSNFPARSAWRSCQNGNARRPGCYSALVHDSPTVDPGGGISPPTRQISYRWKSAAPRLIPARFIGAPAPGFGPSEIPRLLEFGDLLEPAPPAASSTFQSAETSVGEPGRMLNLNESANWPQMDADKR